MVCKVQAVYNDAILVVGSSVGRFHILRHHLKNFLLIVVFHPEVEERSQEEAEQKEDDMLLAE